MKKVLTHEGGYSTVFFCLMFMAFLGVFSLCAAALGNIMALNEQMRQASTASQVLLSHYDDDLESGYGLLAYDQRAVDAEAVFKPYFQDRWQVKPLKTLASLEAFQEQAISLGKLSAAESVVKQVGAESDAGAEAGAGAKPGDGAAGQAGNPQDQSSVASVKANQANYYGQGSGSEEYRNTSLSRAEKKRARKLKSRLNNLSAPVWQIKDGGQIPAAIYDKRHRFDEATAVSLNLAERGFVSAYLFDRFNDYVQWQIHPNQRPRQQGLCFEGGEIEFILEGRASAKENQWLVCGKIFAMREGVNLLHIVKSQEKMSYTAGLASLICALFPLGEPLVQAGLVGMWASIESAYDVNELLAGRSIPLVKLSGSDWYTDLESGQGSGSKPMTADGLNRIDYRGCLRVLLLAQNDKQTAARTLTLIEMNLQKGGKPAPVWDQLTVRHQVKVTTKGGKETSFEDGYMETQEQ